MAIMKRARSSSEPPPCRRSTVPPVTLANVVSPEVSVPYEILRARFLLGNGPEPPGRPEDIWNSSPQRRRGTRPYDFDVCGNRLAFIGR